MACVSGFAARMHTGLIDVAAMMNGLMASMGANGLVSVMRRRVSFTHGVRFVLPVVLVSVVSLVLPGLLGRGFTFMFIVGVFVHSLAPPPKRNGLCERDAVEPQLHRRRQVPPGRETAASPRAGSSSLAAIEPLVAPPSRNCFSATGRFLVERFFPVASGIQSSRGSFRSDYRRYDPRKYGQMINPRTAFQNERPRKPIVKSQPMNQITPAKPPAAVDLHLFCSSDMRVSFSRVQSEDKSCHALMANILH